MSRELGLGVVAWSPLAAGILTGKYNKNDGKGSGGRMEGTTSYRLNERNYDIAATVMEIAEEVGASAPQVALAWISAQGPIPIIGARTLDQLKDNLGSLDVQLSPQQLEKLNEVSQIDLGFPHDFVVRPGAQKMIYGGMVNQIKGNKHQLVNT